MNTSSSHRRGRRLLITLVLVLASAAAPSAQAQSCTGDCRATGRVSISDLILAVNIVLGLASLDQCPALGAGPVGISHLIASVNNALCACQPCPTPPATATVTAIPTPTASPTPEAIVTRWRENNFMLPSSSCPSRINQEIRRGLTGMSFDYTVTQIGQQAEMSDDEGNRLTGTIDAEGVFEVRQTVSQSEGACVVTLDILQIVDLSRSPTTARTEIDVSTRNCPTPVQCSLVITSRWTQLAAALRARATVAGGGSMPGPAGVVLRAIP